MYQVITQREFHPHALQAHIMVVASTGWTKTLIHMPGINFTDYNYNQQHHELRLHLFQAQAQ